MWKARYLRVAALVGALLFVESAAWAQQAIWPVARMLQETSASSIQLRTKDGNVADRIDRAAVQRSQEVLHKLAPAYGMTTPELVLTVSSSPNAFATIRDGKPMVGINSEMLRMIGDSHDNLAVVMGHELGHLQARHTTDGAQRAAAVSILGAVLGAMVDINQARQGRNTHGLGAAFGGIGANLMNAKFSRDQEREADRLGINAMAKAGFNPASAPGLWRLMATRGSSGSGLWMSTHPSHAERESELVALARELEPVYALNRIQAPAEVVARVPTIASLVVQGDSGQQPTSAVQTTSALTSGSQLSDRERTGQHVDRAAAGDARSLAELALLHLSGEGGVTKDYVKARTYSERATQAGDPLGTAVFGALVRDGIAGAGDVERGLKLLQDSAAAGTPWAHYQLGVTFDQGIGVTPDRARAISHYKFAAPSVRAAQERVSALVKAE